MNLGEKIYELRTRKNLSQGDIADALDVSRQSVSKWENNNAVPDLEKVIKLAEIFEVSLDELVLDKATEDNSHRTDSNKAISFEPTASNNAPHTESAKSMKKAISSTQRTIGIVLLCTAAVLLLCLTVLGGISGILAGLLFGSPFILCGILCLTIKHRAGLWCAWTVYFCIDLYLRLATGINWSMIYITPYFEPSMNYLRLATAWIIFFVTLGLMAYTIRCFLKDTVSITKKHLILSVGIFLMLQLLSRLLGSYLIYRWTHIISALLNWGILWAVIGVGVSVIRYVQNKKRN